MAMTRSSMLHRTHTSTCSALSLAASGNRKHLHGNFVFALSSARNHLDPSNTSIAYEYVETSYLIIALTETLAGSFFAVFSA